tara:strand:+ start:371 stop:577 length:207 start_codon:yes stop_codon:yes gene_type:complete
MVYFEKMGRGAHQVPGYIAAKKIVSVKQSPVDEGMTEIYTLDGRFTTVPGKVVDVTKYIIDEGTHNIF